MMSMESAESQFDLAVIGAGPGGYVAAIRAAQLGLKTAIVEREHLGGICLNWGCIPTKALLRTAELYHQMGRATEFGLACDNLRFDLARVVERSRKVAARLSNGVAYLMKKNKIAVIDGEAALKGEGRVAIAGKDGETRTIDAKHIVIATGARARELPGLEADGRLVWTYKHAMVPPAFPKSLLVIGSGAIGIEFASFYRTLGAEVTVVELLDRILPAEDAEISALARKAFAKQGMTIHTGTGVEGLVRHEDSVTARLAKPGSDRRDHRRPRHPRHRHHRQCRRPRPRRAGRQDREGPHRGRRMGCHRQPRPLRHRRRGQPSLACAQSEPRRRAVRGEDRRRRRRSPTRQDRHSRPAPTAPRKLRASA